MNPTMGKFFIRVSGKEGRSEETLKLLRTKAKRRALRHFQGKTVTHRVVKKDETSIEFAFYRRSGKPVNIRLRYESVPKKKAAVKVTAVKKSSPKRKAL